MVKAIPREMPILVLTPDIMVLPDVIKEIILTPEYSKHISERYPDESEIKVLAIMSKSRKQNPQGLYNVGVISNMAFNPEDKREVQLYGNYRAVVTGWTKNDGWLIASVESFYDRPEEEYFDSSGGVSPGNADIFKAKMMAVKSLIVGLINDIYKSGIELNTSRLESIVHNFDEYISTKEHIEYLFWNILDAIPEVTVKEKQLFIENDCLTQRIEETLSLIYAKAKIIQGAGEVRKNLKKLKVSELDKTDNLHPEIVSQMEKYNEIEKKISREIKEAILEDFKALKNMNSPDHHEWEKYMKHLDFILHYPHGVETVLEKDLDKVRHILDQDHYGLDVVKESILNNIAPLSLSDKTNGGILCFVGPAGVGKTSLGASIARATNRPFIRMSVGGIKDESVIRGHGFTYIGSKTGEIAKRIKSCGAVNPVFMLDEIDKLGGMSHNGDPQSAMLEVLDPEQNSNFRDNYIGAGLDLSKVLFIATGNIEQNILPPLLDRMDVMRLPGYTEPEKIEIAVRHLIPRLLKSLNIVKDDGTSLLNVVWAEGVISEIIQNYTSEAGVRNLERALRTILQKVCRLYLKNPQVGEFIVNSAVVTEFLGPSRSFRDKARPTRPGEIIGLAWTESGGAIMKTEAITYPRPADKKILTITGLQGDVMKEADLIALTVIRARAEEFFGLKMAEKLRNDIAIHIHIPEGAIPKDGPSAGITIFNCLYSMLSKKVAKPFIAMTGELTLMGDVLPVGGILEKMVAAERSGIKEVILPEANMRNLYNIPASVKDELIFHPVKHIDQIFDLLYPDGKKIR